MISFLSSSKGFIVHVTGLPTAIIASGSGGSSGNSNYSLLYSGSGIGDGDSLFSACRCNTPYQYTK